MRVVYDVAVRTALMLAVIFVAANAVAADYPLSAPPIGPSPRSSVIPAVSKLGDMFLAVWSENDGGLRATRVDRSGKPVDARSFMIASRANTSRFYVAASGTGAFVCWTVNAPNSFLLEDFRLSHVDGNGLVTPVPIPPTADVVGIAANEQNILIVSLKEGALAATATLLDPGGAVVRADFPFPIVAGRINQVSLAAADDGFLVNYSVGDDFEELHIVRLTTSGILSGDSHPSDQMIARSRGMWSSNAAANGSHVVGLWHNDGGTYAQSVSAPGTSAPAPVYLGYFSFVSSVVPSGDGFLATFFENYPGSVQNIVVARLTAAGQLVSLARTPLAGTEYLNAKAAVSGPSAIMVWVRAGVAVAAPVADATIGSPTVVSLAPANDQRVRALFATPSGAFAVWSEAAPNQRVVVGRVDGNGKPLDGAGFRLRESFQSQVGIAAAFDGRKVLVAWVERNSTPESLYAAIVDTTGPVVERVFQVNGNVTSQSDLAAAWNGSEFVVVWQRRPQSDLAGVRVSRAGDLIDVVPAVLTPPRPSEFFADANPRISWNGSEYLLAWQRQRYYSVFTGVGETTPDTVADLVAQRIARDLFPDGAPIDLFTGKELSNAQGVDIASANGNWLVAWYELQDEAVRHFASSAFSRIDSSGTRLDPLNGRSISDLFPEDAKHVVSSRDGWIVGSGQRFVAISTNGAAAPFVTVSPGAIDAMAIDSPIPMVAYSAVTDGDLRAFIHIVSQRRRVVGH